MNLKINNILGRQNYLLIILGFVWLIMQSFLFWKNGIVTELEAQKYIYEAEYFIQNGTLSSGNFWLYSTEIFLIAVIMKLRLSFAVIVVIQLLLNLFASWMFFQLAKFYLKNPVLAFAATFFYLINVTYQVYNSYLFTESVFYSLVIIYSSFLLRMHKPGIKNITILILMLLLMSVTRPTGILFFVATLIYLFFAFLNKASFFKKLLIISGSITVFFLALNMMLQSGGSLDFMLPFKQENIICGVNTFHNADIQILEKGNSVNGLIYYLVHNYEQFFRLARLKTVAFFGLTRSYYTSFHNAYLILFFYPFYLLSIARIIKIWRRKDKISIYLISTIILYWLTTLMTCDDWHNRFILTVSPFIFLLGIAAFVNESMVHKRETVQKEHES